MKINKGAIIRKIQEKYMDKEIPNFKAGDVVRVNMKIKEGDKERIQAFEGLVIAIRRRKSVDGSFIVRKTYPGQIAMEKIFPLYSPLIDSIEVLRRGRVRRAKLYYMRERFGKKARIEEIR